AKRRTIARLGRPPRSARATSRLPLSSVPPSRRSSICAGTSSARCRRLLAPSWLGWSGASTRCAGSRLTDTTCKGEPMSKEVAVVSYCRTGIAKAVRGALNQTHGIPLAAHVLKHAVERARIEPGEVEDVVLGCGLPEGATGHNIARNAALEAGLGVA